MCIIRYDWLIVLYLFISLVRNASFLIINTVVSWKNSVIFRFFFRHNCKKSLWKNIFLVSLHSQPSPLVCAPPQLTIFPSLTSFLMCQFLSVIPSTAALFARNMISNAYNALSKSSIILDDEFLPSLSSFPPFIVFHDVRDTVFER